MKTIVSESPVSQVSSPGSSRLMLSLGVFAVSVFVLEGACLAAGIDFGGKSMASELPFVGTLAATAQDVMFVASKVVGGILAFVGVKNAGQRNWEHALPALGGGAALFFLPQIVSALSSMAGK